MIEKLDGLTVAQFVDLLCGNTKVLTPGHEIVPESKLSAVAKNIIYEYRSIADSPGAKKYLSEAEELVKAKLNEAVFSICKNLAAMKEFDRVREVLGSCDIGTEGMTDSRILAEIESRLERAKLAIADFQNTHAESRDTEPQNIRSDFDAQTASLMAHFRFQIDTTTMKASLYAHLMAKCTRETKARLAALKKTRRGY